MLEDLGRAFALVLVIEGLMPFALPARWRMTMLQISSLGDRELRMVGLMSMIAGLVTLQLIRILSAS